jgi:hypothetical protein
MLASDAIGKDLENPVIVDLGRRKRSSVRRLCQGEGPLVDELKGCLEELKASGAISATAQPVVLVIRERAKRRSILWPGM